MKARFVVAANMEGPANSATVRILFLLQWGDCPCLVCVEYKRSQTSTKFLPSRGNPKIYRLAQFVHTTGLSGPTRIVNQTRSYKKNSSWWSPTTSPTRLGAC